MSTARNRLLYVFLGLLLAVAGAAAAFDAPFGLRDDSSAATIEVAFSPGDRPTRLIVEAIQNARKQILVQAFSFTHREIADALLAAQRRGVEVHVLADKRQTSKLKNSVVPLLASHGVSVLLDGRHDSAHDKVMIIDADGAPVVITGSFNFTFAAEHKNSENLLVIRGNLPLTQAYLNNWLRHRQHAQIFRAASDGDAVSAENQP